MCQNGMPYVNMFGMTSHTAEAPASPSAAKYEQLIEQPNYMNRLRSIDALWIEHAENDLGMNLDDARYASEVDYYGVQRTIAAARLYHLDHLIVSIKGEPWEVAWPTVIKPAMLGSVGWVRGYFDQAPEPPRLQEDFDLDEGYPAAFEQWGRGEFMFNDNLHWDEGAHGFTTSKDPWESRVQNHPPAPSSWMELWLRTSFAYELLHDHWGKFMRAHQRPMDFTSLINDKHTFVTEGDKFESRLKEHRATW